MKQTGNEAQPLLPKKKSSYGVFSCCFKPSEVDEGDQQASLNSGSYQEAPPLLYSATGETNATTGKTKTSPITTEAHDLLFTPMKVGDVKRSPAQIIPATSPFEQKVQTKEVTPSIVPPSSPFIVKSLPSTPELKEITYKGLLLEVQRKKKTLIDFSSRDVQAVYDFCYKKALELNAVLKNDDASSKPEEIPKLECESPLDKENTEILQLANNHLKHFAGLLSQTFALSESFEKAYPKKGKEVVKAEKAEQIAKDTKNVVAVLRAMNTLPPSTRLSALLKKDLKKIVKRHLKFTEKFIEVCAKGQLNPTKAFESGVFGNLHSVFQAVINFQFSPALNAELFEQLKSQRFLLAQKVDELVQANIALANNSETTVERIYTAHSIIKSFATEEQYKEYSRQMDLYNKPLNLAVKALLEERVNGGAVMATPISQPTTPSHS